MVPSENGSPAMSLQFLIDNTRAELNFSEELTNYLTAQLIHSTLFHEEILYLDAYLANPPFVKNAADKNPIIYDIFDLPCTNIALMKGNSSLMDNFEYLCKNKIFNPRFTNYDDFLSCRDFIERVGSNKKIISYDFNSYRENFSKQLFDYFTSNDAVEKMNKSAGISENNLISTNALREILSEMIEDNAAYKSSKTLSQADFERANRSTCHFEEKFKEHFPTIEYNHINPFVSRIEQYFYRKARASVLPGAIISHPRMRKVDFEIHKVNEFEKIQFSISSEWFNFKNLLSLDLNSIDYIRNSDEFKEYINTINCKYCENIDSSNGFDAAILVAVDSLKKYIKFLDSVIREKIPVEKRNVVYNNHKKLNFYSKLSATYDTLSETHNIETLKAIGNSVEILLKIADDICILPNNAPNDTVIKPFFIYLFGFALNSYNEKINTDKKIKILQDKMKKDFGEKLTIDVNYNGDTAY